MAKLTKKIESQIRDLGLALKLQLDFAAAADMTKPADQMTLAQNNMRAGIIMIDLIKALNITAADDAGIMDAIVAYAEKNGSDAAKVLKLQVPKVRAINKATADLLAERTAEHQAFTGADMNNIFRKHLAP